MNKPSRSSQPGRRGRSRRSSLHPLNSHTGLQQPWSTRVARKAGLSVAAVALVVVVAACSGATTGAQSISASSATLRATVSCAQGQTCDAYFQWRVDGTTGWTKGPDIGPITGQLSEPLSDPISVSPGTVYDYQLCGRATGLAPYPQYGCVGPQDGGSYSTFTSLQPEAQAAITAQQFADSIGVNYHYRNNSNPASTTQAVADMHWLGVTDVRMDAIHSANSGFNSFVWGEWTTVQKAGFKIDVMIPPGCSDYYSQWDPKAVGDCIQQLETQDPGLAGVEAFENPNEPDLSGSPTWNTDLVPWMNALGADAPINPATGKRYPVYGPAVACSWCNPTGAQVLAGTSGFTSSSFDDQNFHDYTELNQSSASNFQLQRALLLGDGAEHRSDRRQRDRVRG